MKKKLKIVLAQDVQNLGLFGEIKEVAAGYARNFLVPKGLAFYLKDPQAKQILKKAEEMRKEKEKELEKLRELSQKLEGLKLEIKAKATKEGKLYAKIGPKEILKVLEKEHKIKLKEIEMEILKEVGEREVVANLGQNIRAKFKVIVSKEGK